MTKKAQLPSKHGRTATRTVHAGAAPVENGGAFNEGPVFASTFHLRGDIDSTDYQYGRFSNPTWASLEQALGELEGGSVCVFPSGMAAVAAVLTSFTRQGARVLMQSDGYYASRAYAERFLMPFGVEVVWLATRDFTHTNFSDFDLVFAETPSNPLMEVIDIEQLATKCTASKARLVIDNTTMTPLGQQPLAHGADLVVCSDTKAVNGHSDVVFGHVAAANQSDLDEVRLWRKLSGNIPGPMESWLVHRGLASLDMRLERMCDNAQAIAEYLSQHPKVVSVYYPGLANHPNEDIISRQHLCSGYVISFDLGTKILAEQFFEKSTLIYEATSFGGMHTMAERRARWGTDKVSEGLVRLSVGCEAQSDLLERLAQALS